MIFDLRTIESTAKFIEDLYNINYEDQINYVLSCSSGADVYTFLNFFDLEKKDYELDDIKLIASHVSTTRNGLDSYMCNGLVNLKKMLSKDTDLALFLKNFNIEFDIKGRNLKHGGNLYDISYPREKGNLGLKENDVEEKLKWLGRKVYHDSQISAFFSMESDVSYGGYVHERPEVLVEISNLLKKDFSSLWKRDIEAYVFEFEEKISSFELYTFDAKYKDDILIGDWLLKKALNRIWDDFHMYSCSEVFAYVKDDYVIPWKNVINVRKIAY